MAHGEVQEERGTQQVDEMSEETFLKDIYLYMKKRDTPIERIPHLGFKQIDLFVMYKTVKALGGYHQVTAQQLWKQVYNTLGGNPRSTSAATCTRRHYEKLLLPYECHVKGGELMNLLPHHQPKHFHYDSKEDDGPRPAKRRPLPPLHQNTFNVFSDSHTRVIPLPVHYPHYYQQGHPLLPPYVPMPSSLLSPCNPPAPRPQFSYNPSPQRSTEMVQPLEHLRYLAEQYKSTSGLTEPLNLSLKASSLETKSHASSFTPPPSSKNPKFLNKPSPLYPTKGVARDEGCETQNNKAGLEESSSVSPNSYPLKAREGYVINLKATSTTSSSPTFDSATTLRIDPSRPIPQAIDREGLSTMAHMLTSSKADCTNGPREERQESPKLSQRALNLSPVPPSPPRENGGEIEIQIPLSHLHDWIRMCAPSTTLYEAKQRPRQEADTRERSWSSSDSLPTNLTLHRHPRDQDSSTTAQDLNTMQRNVPSPTLNNFTSSRFNISPYHFSGYKTKPSGGFLSDASSRDAFPWDQQDMNKPYNPKHTNGWDPYERDSQALPLKLKIDSTPLIIDQDFVNSKSPVNNAGTPQRKVKRSGKHPSAVLMGNSASASLLHLTSEELMKLKRIISSSS
ncbi:AT-rich interaction domain 6 [Polymixia lowei]